VSSADRDESSPPVLSTNTKAQKRIVDGSSVTLTVSRPFRRPARGIPPSVVLVARRQKGGSQSRLVLCDDGKKYILKMHPNPQGPNVLANEALGSMLLKGLGLSVPAWRPITISLRTLRCFPELTMETVGGSTLPACGVHFGSEYVGGPQYDLFDLIPESYRTKNSEQVAAMNLFDLWANHHDNRQCVYRRPKMTGDYEAFFIDNGHLFGGPEWSVETTLSSKLWSRYVHTSECLAMERWLTLFEDRIPGLLHEAKAAIPSEWYGADINSLCEGYLRRLWRLRAIVESSGYILPAAVIARVRSIIK
jgi:hypothetical protein